MFLQLLVAPRHPPADAARRCGLWEWAAIDGQVDAGQRLGGATWITLGDRLEREIGTLAAGLRTLSGAAGVCGAAAGTPATLLWRSASGSLSVWRHDANRFMMERGA